MNFKEYNKMEKKLDYYKQKCIDCENLFPFDCGNCLIKQKRLVLDDKIHDANIRLMTMEFFF